mmetsp:Transcript_21244/g.42214  ORF Transcript_21244/g.42214 Transcript_21244/m.42214 type:complete len:111 (+) Transcript_21244:305-637(+)
MIDFAPFYVTEQGHTQICQQAPLPCTVSLEPFCQPQNSMKSFEGKEEKEEKGEKEEDQENEDKQTQEGEGEVPKHSAASFKLSTFITTIDRLCVKQKSRKLERHFTVLRD